MTNPVYRVQAVSDPDGVQSAPGAFGEDPCVDLQVQMTVRIPSPGGVVPHHRRLNLLHRDLDLTASRPDPGGGVLGQPADDLLGRAVLRAVMSRRDLRMQDRGQRPRLRAVDHDLHKPHRSSVCAHPALGRTRGRSYPPTHAS